MTENAKAVLDCFLECAAERAVSDDSSQEDMNIYLWLNTTPVTVIANALTEKLEKKGLLKRPNGE